MSPPPEKSTPSMSAGMAAPGSRTTTSAPRSRSVCTYRSRAARFCGVRAAETVSAIRGRPIAFMLTSELEQLDEHATRGAGVQERDASLDAVPRGAVDQLDAVCGQAVERAGEVRHREAQVVHRGAPALGHEARDAGVGVGRLEQ